MPYLETPSPLERVLSGAGHDPEAARPRFPIDLAWPPLPRTPRAAPPALRVPEGADPTADSGDGPDESDGSDGPDGSAGLSLQDASGALLAQIEELEAERARLDARIVAAYGALHTVVAEQFDQHDRVMATIRAAKGRPARRE